MTSRASRMSRVVEKIERSRREQIGAARLLRRYEICQLIEETVPTDEIIELTREIHHSADEESVQHLAELIADASARFDAGERPGRPDRRAIEWFEGERRALRRDIEAQRRSV